MNQYSNGLFVSYSTHEKTQLYENKLHQKSFITLATGTAWWLETRVGWPPTLVSTDDKR